LRGLAILIVVSFHYVYFLSAPRHSWWKPLAQGLSLFWSGVDLFFVLSGFLIAGILFDSAESPSYFRTFYMRRIHRIFPLYYGWMALFFAGLALGLDQQFHFKIFEGSVPLGLYPLFLQNNAPLWLNAEFPPWMAMTWSLAVEEQFYLALPAIVRFADRTVVAWLCGAVIALSPVYRWAMVSTHRHLSDTWSFATIARLDGLAMGVAAALLVRNERCWRWLTNNRRTVHALLALLFCGFLVMTWFPTTWYSRTVDHFTALSAMYCTALMAAVCFPGSGMSHVLTRPLLRYFGRVSYAVYMFHSGVGALLGNLVPTVSTEWSWLRASGVVVASFAVTMALAEVSWRLMESRLIRRAHTRYRY
jgi:peptidoglycan/LPS O-acetylase OafA/YrhL